MISTLFFIIIIIEGRPNLLGGGKRQDTGNLWYQCSVHTSWVRRAMEQRREQVHLSLPWFAI